MLTRQAALTAATTALLLLDTGPARTGDDIWASLDCSQGPVAGCELSMEQPQQPSTQKVGGCPRTRIGGP